MGVETECLGHGGRLPAGALTLALRCPEVAGRVSKSSRLVGLELSRGAPSGPSPSVADSVADSSAMAEMLSRLRPPLSGEPARTVRGLVEGLRGGRTLEGLSLTTFVLR